MGNIGLFLPYLVIFCVAMSLLLGLIDKWTQPKGSYEKWLEEELERNPGYINWLRYANSGRDYKLGLRILKKIKRDKGKAYNKWFKRVRKEGKY